MHYHDFIKATNKSMIAQYRALRVQIVRWAIALEDDAVATAALEVLEVLADESDVGLAVEICCVVEAAMVSEIDPVVTIVVLSVT
jgi:hypothetical protein